MTDKNSRSNESSSAMPAVKPETSAKPSTLLSTRTPFYRATQAPRYERQLTIRRIQKQTKRALICYIAGMEAPVDRDDTLGFVDLLHEIPDTTDVDLLLHTGGGDVDAADKLITLVRSRVGNAVLRVVVPDFAKSAGTLMVLGADRVLMSETSELGPIDPQIVLSDSNGNRIPHSIQSVLDAYDLHSKALAENPADVAAKIMLEKLDPATVRLFQVARERARQCAEEQLKLGMFRNLGGNFSKTAAALIDTNRWQSHGQMISWRAAASPEIGLIVDHVEQGDPAWQLFWQLYCLQRLAIQPHQKLFESAKVSLVLDGPGRSFDGGGGRRATV